MTEAELRFHRRLLFLNPPLILLFDLWRQAAPADYRPSLLASMAFLCFVAGLPALYDELSPSSQQMRRLAVGMVFVGASAGAIMQAMFRSATLLRQRGFEEASDLLLTSPLITFTTRSPGILYPLGLLLVAALLARHRLAVVGSARARFGLLPPALLALGAVLFPVGRIGGFETANLASAVLLGVAWWLILRPFGTVA